MAATARPRSASVARQQMLEGTEHDEQSAVEAIANAGGGDGDEDEDDGDPLDELVGILQNEADASLGQDGDAIATDQIKAFERYIGKDYGDEIDGQSRVHTREVFETIEWIRPDCARIFASGSGSIEVETWEGGTPEDAENATKLIQDLVFGKKENQEESGLALVDGFLFNGALQKIGVIAVRWEEERMGPPRRYENLNILQAQQLGADKNAEVIGGEPGEPDEAGQPTYHLTVQHQVTPARPVMQLVAPEDFRCSKRATSLGRPTYCGYDMRLSKAEVIDMFPDKEELIEESADAAREGFDQDERRAARFQLDEDGADARLGVMDGDDVLVSCEYIHHDLDGDGYPELLECWRMGSVMLEAEPADENCFAAWSPTRIPHKLVGLGVADSNMDIQRINTVMMRSAVNATMLAVAPRTAASNKVNLNDLLTVRPGAVIRLKEGENAPNGMAAEIFPLTTPDVSGSALRMMEKVDSINETRTGVTRHAQGLNPDVLNKTMGGIELLQNAASVRKEMMLRNLADGFELALTKFLRLLIRHGDKTQKAKVGKAWQTFDITNWSPNATVKVDVGQGAGNRQTQLMNLNFIAQKQEAVIARLGVDNPLVTPVHYYNTIEQATRVMGFSSADPFFRDPRTLSPEELQKLMAPKPNPEMQKLQAQMAEMQQKLQLAEAALQQKGQLKQMEIASDAQLEREQTAVEAQLSREETAAKTIASVNNQPHAPIVHTRIGGDKV